MANLQKATVFAIKEETTVGTPVAPTGGTDFVPLKTGFSMTPNLEELTNNELANNLGQTKSFTGKETPSGSHGIYLKHSQVEGTAPEYGLLIESALGGTTTAAAEYNTVAGSTVGVINVDAGEGASYSAGEALLVKDATNGYKIRNISSISTDALSINFNLGTAPGVGVNLGKSILYYPTTTGHPTFTSWMYRANSACVEMVAGCKVSSMSMTFTAGQQAECDFSYEGTGYYFNPVTITASNKFLDITDDAGTILVTLTEGVYKDPVEFAAHVTTVVGAALLASGGDDFLCTYSSSTGKYTMATTTGTTFSILWKTGTKGSDNTDTHVGTTMGYSDTADDTGAKTYTSDTALTYAAPYTPTYDNADNIIVKSAELLIGSATDNVCRKASSVSISIDTPSVDADSICATSGVYEKVATGRTVTMTASLILEAHEAHIFNKFINATSTQAMLNIGPKSGGNWVAGKCVNIYFGNATISTYATGGDDFITLEVTVKGFITSTLQDIYINFV